jgi:hypothetical protein
LLLLLLLLVASLSFSRLVEVLLFAESASFLFPAEAEVEFSLLLIAAGALVAVEALAA